jgi:phosphonate transport system substrate-binding protein
MSARILAGLFALAVVGTAASGRQPAPAGNARLRLAVLPCTSIEATFRKFHPLLGYLESATGRPLRLVTPADLDELEAATDNGRIDFALQDPHSFRALAGLFDDESLLQTRGLDGSTGQAAVVLVPRDSDVQRLEELRGRVVMFGPRTSSPKWVAARRLFEARGLSVERDVRTLNGGCCEDIAFEVALKAVDAGVVCDHFLGLHDARQKDLGIDPGSLRVIGRTAPVPTRLFAARRGVPRDVVAAVTAALAGLDPAKPGHAAILASAEIRGFFRTTRAEYLRALELAERAAGGP